MSLCKWFFLSILAFSMILFWKKEKKKERKKHHNVYPVLINAVTLTLNIDAVTLTLNTNHDKYEFNYYHTVCRKPA